MKLSLIALVLALFGTSNALRLSKETHEGCATNPADGVTYCY